MNCKNIKVNGNVNSENTSKYQHINNWSIFSTRYSNILTCMQQKAQGKGRSVASFSEYLELYFYTNLLINDEQEFLLTLWTENICIASINRLFHQLYNVACTRYMYLSKLTNYGYQIRYPFLNISIFSHGHASQSHLNSLSIVRFYTKPIIMIKVTVSSKLIQINFSVIHIRMKYA